MTCGLLDASAYRTKAQLQVCACNAGFPIFPIDVESFVTAYAFFPSFFIFAGGDQALSPAALGVCSSFLPPGVFQCSSQRHIHQTFPMCLLSNVVNDFLSNIHMVKRYELECILEPGACLP